MAAERSELEKLLESTTAATDAENGLPDAETPETPDQPETPAAEEQPAESKKEEAASSKEQTAESKKEEAASSKEQPAESKKEEAASSKEQPAESKKEEAASSKTQPVEQKQSYTATKTVPYGNDTQSSSYTTTEKVEYQIGGTTIRLTQQYTDTTEDHVSNEKYVTSETTTDVYTLSQPLQAMERKGDWQVVWDVPAGTVVTLKGTLTGTDSGPLGTDKYSDSRSGVYGIIVSRVLSNDEVDSSAGSYPSFYGESVTIEKGKLYQLTDANEGGTFNEKGGFVFRGV